jgi:hypothetical protein
MDRDSSRSPLEITRPWKLVSVGALTAGIYALIKFREAAVTYGKLAGRSLSKFHTLFCVFVAAELLVLPAVALGAGLPAIGVATIVGFFLLSEVLALRSAASRHVQAAVRQVPGSRLQFEWAIAHLLSFTGIGLIVMANHCLRFFREHEAFALTVNGVPTPTPTPERFSISGFAKRVAAGTAIGAVGLALLFIGGSAFDSWRRERAIAEEAKRERASALQQFDERVASASTAVSQGEIRDAKHQVEYLQSLRRDPRLDALASEIAALLPGYDRRRPRPRSRGRLTRSGRPRLELQNSSARRRENTQRSRLGLPPRRRCSSNTSSNAPRHASLPTVAA